MYFCTSHWAPSFYFSYYIEKVDISLNFFWYDPRLVFWNPTQLRSFDCDEIWAPRFLMRDSFRIPYDEYRSTCQISEYPPAQRSGKDPYMGQFCLSTEFCIMTISLASSCERNGTHSIDASIDAVSFRSCSSLN